MAEKQLRDARHVCEYAAKLGVKLICGLDQAFCSTCQDYVMEEYGDRTSLGVKLIADGANRTRDTSKCFGMFTVIAHDCLICPRGPSCAEAFKSKTVATFGWSPREIAEDIVSKHGNPRPDRAKYTF